MDYIPSEMDSEYHFFPNLTYFLPKTQFIGTLKQQKLSTQRLIMRFFNGQILNISMKNDAKLQCMTLNNFTFKILN